MPHTSRRKLQNQTSLATKRHQTTTPDGWTHIHRGPPPLSTLADPSNQLRSPRPASMNITDLEDQLLISHQNHKRFTKIWRAMSCCAELERILEREVLREENMKIDSCVCLGLGPFANTRSGKARAEKSWLQLVALETMLDVLGRKHNIAKVIFQEPQFDNLDTRYLEERRYAVMQDPAAFEQITERTFVYCPLAEVDVVVRALTAVEQGPALFIGTRLDGWLDGTWHNAAMAQRAKPLVSFRDRTVSVQVPPCEEDGTWFNDTRIYWKPTKGEPTSLDS